ncbi:hypothetical protein IW261DRAFT_1564709 [Armillaria novae-zelandiae]|uniref:Uncharacterized protein n=1 Tax=Armillaria novae-zelandiae TaxID=153914 RepID=A0AA39TC54_9AGAR|nr:hypothetical protein IW261DRAFT_1564709 [Armillaria novae-zelandiae]
MLVCDSLNALCLALTNFQQFLHSVILWTASRINHSVLKGFEVRLNWGAFIGLKWEDFLFGVSPATVIMEVCKHGMTAKEVYAYYKADDAVPITPYIPHLPVHYPDIVAYMHFPYHPRYSRMDFFKSLPCILTNQADNNTSMTSTLVSPYPEDNGNVKMKDQWIEDMMTSGGH